MIKVFSDSFLPLLFTLSIQAICGLFAFGQPLCIPVSYTHLPRVDLEILEKYSDGLICLSGCIAGEIAKKLINREYESAKKAALNYERIYGKGNYYLEVQNHGIKDEIEIIPMLKKLSIETGIPLAATNDSHYIEMCIRDRIYC